LVKLAISKGSVPVMLDSDRVSSSKVEANAISVGIVPLIPGPPIWRDSSSVMFQINSGMVPWSARIRPKSSLANWVTFSSSATIVPVKSVPPRARSFKSVAKPMSVGSGPVSAMSETRNLRRFVMFHQYKGTVPVKRFSDRSISTRSVRLSQVCGMVPLKKLSSRLSSIKVVTLPSSSGKVPLNKLSSRSIVTSSCVEEGHTPKMR